MFDKTGGIPSEVNLICLKKGDNEYDRNIRSVMLVLAQR